MRGKRSKQYRKLMKQFALTFHFREPFQVLVDAQMIQDADRFAMDLVKGLERTLHGKVKPMITQCSIRHLYNLSTAEFSASRKDALISQAKDMERRRCNHHTLDQPLPTRDCFSHIIDPKNSQTNKNRYIVASQDEDVRAFCRAIKGVPLVYVKRSVMVMEPMAESSQGVQSGLEREKMRSGIIKAKADLNSKKRKRGDKGTNSEQVDSDGGDNVGAFSVAKKRKSRGPKGPNPLSVKKAKPVLEPRIHPERASRIVVNEGMQDIQSSQPALKGGGKIDHVARLSDENAESTSKRKRRRKHKSDVLNEVDARVFVGAEEDKT